MSTEDKKPKVVKEIPRELPNLNERINHERANSNKTEKSVNRETRIPTFETPIIPPKNPSEDKSGK